MPRHNYERMHERHGDPLRRPSVDLLITKLRKLSSLQNHPDAVLAVIHDLSYQYFVNRQQRPWELKQLLSQTMLQLQIVLGVNLEDAELTTPEQREAFLESVGMDADPPTPDPDSEYQQILPPDLAPPSHTIATDSTAGEAPEDESWNTETLKEYLKPQRDGAETILRSHFPMFIGAMRVKCECKRIYESREEWANHARKRIWRYLLNEFRPDAEG